MDKEILEITKKFHDTYEKLASEYTYETREDTKVFDINSNNGKLMYATVNEIVSPILKENKILKENAENNDKVVDKVNWENMLLKKENYELKSQLKGTTHCFDEEEHEKLKKQLEEYQKELEKADSITQSCIFNGKEESKISYRKCLNILDKKETQQKEFIKYLEDEIKFYKNRDTYIVADILGSYDLNDINLKLLEEILQKYKEIIGGNKDE